VTDYSGQINQSYISQFLGTDFGSTKAFGRGTSQLAAKDQWPTVEFLSNLVAGPGKTNFVVGNEVVGVFDDQSVGRDFYEDFHVIPRAFDFGNILSTQSSPIDVFSGYRAEIRTWSSFVNNAGAGTSIVGIPSLPTVMNPLAGYAMTLEVSTSGNPSVDDDLGFVFDFGVTTINVPIKLNRIVLFPVLPEMPYTERLRFRTDVLPKESGKEQRIKLRKNPRQFFDWRIRIDDGTFDKSRMDTLMFDWQGRTWGVPLWHQGTLLSVAATAGDLTINVLDTDNADYRVAGLAIVFVDGTLFDVQTVASLTSTTVTFSNALLSGYPVGALVAPLRTGVMKDAVTARRFVSGDQEISANFRVLDNDANLADLTGWATYKTKVLLDTCNIMRSGSLTETYLHNSIVIDSGTGLSVKDSPWDNGKRSTTLTLRANTRAEVWDLVQLLHALAGRQVSFYVPTFGKDLNATLPLATASQDLVIGNVGYTQFIRNRQPRNHIWVKLVDGTTFTREITSSVETNSSVETLELDAAWGQDVTVAEIERISYLEEVRFDTDDLSIEYSLGARQVYVTAPIISTFD
jgi:hypothetical protein